MHFKWQSRLEQFGIILFILIIPLMWLSDEAAGAEDDEKDPEPITSSETVSEDSRAAHFFSNSETLEGEPEQQMQGSTAEQPHSVYLPIVYSHSMDPVEREVLDLVNIERAKAGCAPVRFNLALRNAAFLHSKEMADNNYFSHSGLNGSTFSDRAKAAGYTGFPAGENIATGYHSAQSVMKGWMESDGHRQNILNCNHTHVGIGQADNSNSKYKRYWTQIFGQE